MMSSIWYDRHIMSEQKRKKPNKNSQLPESFRPYLWSYDFSKIDPRQDKKTIIVNAINYGTLKEWRWLRDYYGEKEIRRVLTTIPVTELKPRAGKLAGLVFSIKKEEFHHAQRGANRKR